MAHRPDLLPPLQPTAERSPRRGVRWRQIGSLDRPEPGRRRRDQPHRAPHHHPRRRHLAAAASPLVMAIRAEQLLQVVVGPRQAGRVIAGEQPRPVAPRHLQEVADRIIQIPGRIAMPLDRPHQPGEPTPHPGGVEPLLVPQDRRRAMHPAERHTHLGPLRLGRLQAPGEDRPQPRQLPREPLLAPTSSRLAATFASRSRSTRPEATSGGRPSSVSDVRTAAQ